MKNKMKTKASGKWSWTDKSPLATFVGFNEKPPLFHRNKPAALELNVSALVIDAGGRQPPYLQALHDTIDIVGTSVDEVERLLMFVCKKCKPV
jgi:hypothetical protein